MTDAKPLTVPITSSLESREWLVRLFPQHLAGLPMDQCELIARDLDRMIDKRLSAAVARADAEQGKKEGGAPATDAKPLTVEEVDAMRPDKMPEHYARIRWMIEMDDSRPYGDDDYQLFRDDMGTVLWEHDSLILTLDAERARAEKAEQELERAIRRGDAYAAKVVNADEEGMAWKDRAEQAEAERDEARRLVVGTAMFGSKCAYCGGRIRIEDPNNFDGIALILRNHLAKCPKHPMRKVEAERDALAREVRAWRAADDAEKWRRNMPYEGPKSIRAANEAAGLPKEEK